MLPQILEHIKKKKKKCHSTLAQSRGRIERGRQKQANPIFRAKFSGVNISNPTKIARYCCGAPSGAQKSIIAAESITGE